MDRKTYRIARRFVRTLQHAIYLECATAARGVMNSVLPTFNALKAAGVDPFGTISQRPGATWIVGHLPRDNWKGGLQRRQLDRVIYRSAYQPGPRKGQLP